jgi:hypothetical protein
LRLTGFFAKLSGIQPETAVFSDPGKNVAMYVAGTGGKRCGFRGFLQ